MRPKKKKKMPTLLRSLLMITDTQSFITGEPFEHISRVQRIEERHTTLQSKKRCLLVLPSRYMKNVKMIFPNQSMSFPCLQSNATQFHITCFFFGFKSCYVCFIRVCPLKSILVTDIEEGPDVVDIDFHSRCA